MIVPVSRGIPRRALASDQSPRMLGGDIDAAHGYFTQQLRTAAEVGHDVGIAYALEALSRGGCLPR